MHCVETAFRVIGVWTEHHQRMTALEILRYVFKFFMLQYHSKVIALLNSIET